MEYNVILRGVNQVISVIKLTLCQGGCCPTVEVAEDEIIIKDDWGGKVSLTKEQLQILVSKYPEIKGQE